MTNADRIRQMTDEELAEKLRCDSCIYKVMKSECESSDCVSGILAWLRKEAKMPAIDRGYAIKTTTGAYYCGYSNIDKQLRKAKIYHSLQYARDAIKSLKESAQFRNFEFIVVNVEVREVSEDAAD